MTLTPNFLPVGSIVEYNCGSEQFSDWQPTRLDWQDLQWLSETPIEFNASHRPIQLTPEILVEWCNMKYYKSWNYYQIKGEHRLKVYPSNIGFYFRERFHFEIQYLHQLQHLYSALTQTVLPITIK